MPKKEKNVTTPVTTSVTTHGYTNQSKSKEEELFVVVEGEVKNFYYLKELFEQDVGLKMKWAQYGFSAEKFSDGIQQWMTINHGNGYDDFSEARKHFLFWLPNYDIKNKNNSNGHNEGFCRNKTACIKAK